MTLREDCPEHPACSSPSGGGCREATGEGEKCKASVSRDFQPLVMIRASHSSAPVCALEHLPPLGEGRRRRGARGPHPASASREIGGCHLPRARGRLCSTPRTQALGVFLCGGGSAPPLFVILSASEGSRRRWVGFAAAAENSCSRRGQDPSSASAPQDDTPFGSGLRAARNHRPLWGRQGRCF